MPITHVFATHAILQERLAAAIVKRDGVPAENVLILKVRGSYRPAKNEAFLTLDGGRYLHVDGWNLPANRRSNGVVYDAFDQEVLQQLAPDFQVYSAMYTYWFVRLLGDRAAAYHILEDGFGSYQTLEEFGAIFTKMTASNWKKRIGKLRTRLALDSRQYLPVTDPYTLLENAGKYFVTSPHCFPFIEDDRRVVLDHVFTPDYVGKYPGITLLATSSLVENDQVELETYLGVLRTVLQKIEALGVTRLHVKLHPVQARHPEYGPLYREVFATYPGLEVTEIGQEISLEALAAGNEITFVTGVSTLAFHISALGATVYNYHADIESVAPGSTDYLADGGIEIFHRITRPL